MLLMTVLPICLSARDTVKVHVSRGGTDVSHSPTINYFRNILLPTLRKMGIAGKLKVNKYGYYPKGMGETTLAVKPQPALQPFRLETFGKLKSIKGISVCTFLAQRRVAERQAKAAKELLADKGYDASIQIVNDKSNPLQKGSSIVLWANTDTGALVGADAIGNRGKTSEAVGKEAAEKLYKEISAKPTVDVHLADILIPYLALAEGTSAYTTRKVTDHLTTNIWLVKKILGTQIKIRKSQGLYRIEKED